MYIDITQDEAIGLYEMFASRLVTDLNAGTLYAIRETASLRDSPSLVGGRRESLYLSSDIIAGIIDDMTDTSWTVREDQKIRSFFDRLVKAGKGDA